MIQILLATYNGEKYIKALLESLFAQVYTDFEIIVSDDGSTDRTVGIIEEFQKLYPGKIRFVPDITPSGGAKNNFFKLMGYADADYIMFCDQDDYWLPDKIGQTLKKMQQTEKDGMPTLVHTDLSVTDKDLNVTHKSYFKLQHLKPTDKINRALVQNCVTGCTVMINKALLELVKNTNGESVIMHDWWIYIIACTSGKVSFVEKPTILYRQHDSNTIGAKGYVLKNLSDLRKSLNKTYNQAEHFLEVCSDFFTQHQKKTVHSYIELKKSSKIKKLYLIFKYGFLKHSFIRKLVHMLIV